MGNIRTGKDADHRQSLNEAARAARPAPPAGALVLTEEDLGAVVGGSRQYSDPREGGESK